MFTYFQEGYNSLLHPWVDHATSWLICKLVIDCDRPVTCPVTRKHMAKPQKTEHWQTLSHKGYVTFGTWQFRYKGVDTFGTWRLRYIWDPFRYICAFCCRASVHAKYHFGTSLCRYRYIARERQFLGSADGRKKCPVDVSLFIVCVATHLVCN